ncbi:uncharacterized protein KY384_002863 [Bacidia gigantensis]|uniref:uncharacterized protein n=1 Tax=Bacidia gigantensis TaxID=2732470 RepID=UPI001D03BAD1|nr:uncharacterized protein KY384_002863 [Bacidia gigantensis]KAG8532378.1 hypothetical protein KY384_002863 [Bacidia gigantensis]
MILKGNLSQLSSLELKGVFDRLDSGRQEIWRISYLDSIVGVMIPNMIQNVKWCNAVEVYRPSARLKAIKDVEYLIHPGNFFQSVNMGPTFEVVSVKKADVAKDRRWTVDVGESSIEKSLQAQAIDLARVCEDPTSILDTQPETRAQDEEVAIAVEERRLLTAFISNAQRRLPKDPDNFQTYFDLASSKAVELGEKLIIRSPEDPGDDCLFFASHADAAAHFRRLDDMIAMTVVCDETVLQDFAIRSNEAFLQERKELDLQNVAVTDYAGTDGAGRLYTTEQILSHHRRRGEEHNLRAATDNNAPFTPPINLLDLQNSEGMGLPPCLRANKRFNLLHTINQKHKDHLGKRSPPLDLSGNRTFTLFGETDAISMTHHDRHGLTNYLTVVTGLKAWFFWPNLTAEEKAAFGARGREGEETGGQYWVGGSPQCVLLRPGWTIIMEPGLPHFVITLKTSLCYGGTMWDRQNMPKTLECIRFEEECDMLTTNEDRARELRPALETLRKLIENERGSPERMLRGLCDRKEGDFMDSLSFVIQKLKRKSR